MNMRILIVGGGKLGYYLAKTLAPDKHHLVLVDEDQDVCKKIANELSDTGIEVIHGDGTDVIYLNDADIEHADILIAVTGYDETNLVACLLAKNYFNVPRTIARVNNPKNINIFKQLGVDSVVSSTALIADIIELEVDWSCLNNMLSQRVGSIRMKEIRVGRHAGVSRQDNCPAFPAGRHDDRRADPGQASDHTRRANRHSRRGLYGCCHAVRKNGQHHTAIRVGDLMMKNVRQIILGLSAEIGFSLLLIGIGMLIALIRRVTGA